MHESPPSQPTGLKTNLFDLFSLPRLFLLVLMLSFLNFFLQLSVSEFVGGTFAAASIATLLCFIGFPWWLARRGGENPLLTYRVAPLSASEVFWLAVLTIGLVLPIDVLTELNMKLVPVPESVIEILEDLRPRSMGAWIVAIVAVVIMAPIGEEIVFRGILQQGARNSMGPAGAAILAALVFATVHLEPFYLAGLLALGLVLGLVFEITGSLLASIFVHAFYNGMSLAFMAVEPAESEPATWSGRSVEFLLAAAGLALARVAYVRLKKTRAQMITSSNE